MVANSGQVLVYDRFTGSLLNSVGENINAAVVVDDMLIVAENEFTVRSYRALHKNSTREFVDDRSGNQFLSGIVISSSSPYIFLSFFFFFFFFFCCCFLGTIWCKSATYGSSPSLNSFSGSSLLWTTTLWHHARETNFMRSKDGRVFVSARAYMSLRVSLVSISTVASFSGITLSVTQLWWLCSPNFCCQQRHCLCFHD